MAQHKAEIELIHLERIKATNRWRFTPAGHPRMETLLGHLIDAHLFQIKTLYFTHGSGYMRQRIAYEISDEGMWFLSHLFSNWEEMSQRFTFGAGESVERCEKCGVFGSLRECHLCDHLFCVGCLPSHLVTHGKQYSCCACYKLLSSAETLRCATCDGYFCHDCFVKDQRRHGNASTHWSKDWAHARYSTHSASASDTGTSWEDLEDWLESRQSGARRSTGNQQTSTKTNARSRYVPHDVRVAFTLLGVSGIPTVEQVKRAYKEKALIAHPDTGGSHEAMVALNGARDCALQWLKAA